MDFFTDEMRRDPFPLYDEMRKSSPLLHLPQFDLWLVFDYEGVRRVINDIDTFSSTASAGGGKPFDWLIFADPPRHTKLRAIIVRAFTPRSVADLEPRIRAISCELLDRALTGSGEMDLAEDFSVPLPMMVIANLLGIPSEDWLRFRHWSDAILHLANTVTGGAEASQAANEYGAATMEMRSYLEHLLDERRSAPKDDLLTRLVNAQVDGDRLTHDEILGFFQLLLLAGSETTTNLINNAILCFMEHPDQLRQIRADASLIPSAIEEVLRFRSPVQAVFRQTARDVELHGQFIPRGQLVLVMIGSANRDATQFPDAERFDIVREPRPHVAFGHGPHFCLGAPLARLEASIALTDLLTRMNSISLASDEPWQPRRALHVHGPTRLPIRFTTDWQPL